MGEQNAILHDQKSTENEMRAGLTYTGQAWYNGVSPCGLVSVWHYIQRPDQNNEYIFYSNETGGSQRNKHLYCLYRYK